MEPQPPSTARDTDIPLRRRRSRPLRRVASHDVTTTTPLEVLLSRLHDENQKLRAALNALLHRTNTLSASLSIATAERDAASATADATLVLLERMSGAARLLQDERVDAEASWRLGYGDGIAEAEARVHEARGERDEAIARAEVRERAMRRVRVELREACGALEVPVGGNDDDPGPVLREVTRIASCVVGEREAFRQKLDMANAELEVLRLWRATLHDIHSRQDLDEDTGHRSDAMEDSKIISANALQRIEKLKKEIEELINTHQR